jgi:HEAT repeat protein
MMKTMNQSPRCARASSSILRYCTVFLLGAALAAAQGRTTKPPVQTKQASGNHPHVATLRSSDSPEGSRVALSSDQSLNDYEAYRRGDRFYIKIPASDVPRAEALRGRGFADVKVQRVGDSTIISFRLPPGASARVEQRANRLEVVFTVAGAGSAIAANASRETPRSTTRAESNRTSSASSANKRIASPLSANKSAELSRNSNANARTAAPTNANKKSADRSTSAAAQNARDSNLTGKSGSATPLPPNSASRPVATPLPTPVSSPNAKPTATPVQRFSSTPSPLTQPTPLVAANQPHQDRWGRMKEQINYWILFAQLNPTPVVTGAIVLLLLIALFLFQRRRAKSTRRVASRVTKATKSATKADAASSLQPVSESKSAPEVNPAVVEMAAVSAVAPKSEAEVTNVKSAPNVDAKLDEDPRRQRIAQVNQEAQKLINGGAYDENVIGSPNPETRQLVGAELLAAIVGRSATRREHARAAFMKHGYFDDATRDLRIADSANERAAAARRLSFVHDSEATPHLAGALDDPSPDVRRAAVEALMDLRDPAAIGPLNSLMQTENDRKVPRTLIKHAIEACATAPAGEVPLAAGPDRTPDSAPDSASHSIETEREVIEL